MNTPCTNTCPRLTPGTRKAHCAACHRTFTGDSAFEAHRRGGRCIDPASILDSHGEPKYAKRTDGAWRAAKTWSGPKCHPDPLRPSEAGRESENGVFSA